MMARAVAWCASSAGATARWHPKSLVADVAGHQSTALRYFTLDGTGHATRKEQGRMARRHIIWRNNHAHDERLRRIINKANLA